MSCRFAARRDPLRDSFRLAFFTVLVLASGVRGDARDFYVAPNGSDAADGSEPHPFATLTRARNAVRDFLRAGRREPVTIHLRGGVYYLSETFRLGAEDSGVADNPVTWRPYGNERVVLSGGKEVSDLRPLSDPDARRRIPAQALDHVLQADLKAAGVTDCGERSQTGFGREQRPAVMELFFRDQAMTVARWPNDAWERIIEVPQPWESGQVPEDAGYYRLYVDGLPLGRHYGFFKYYGDRPKRWSDVQNIWMHGSWAFDYRDSYVKIDRIDTAQRLIYPTPPHPRNWGYTRGQRYYYLNVLEELDSPGEYFVDTAKRLLYFWPPSPPAPGSAYVSMLKDAMVVLDGASHVTFRGFILEGGRSHAVEVKGGSHNQIAGCSLRNFGNYGVLLDGSNNGVQSCDFYGLGEGGVRLAGGDRKTLAPAGNYVVNSHFHRYARINLANHPAVRLGGVGNRVAHNYIHDVPHGAISLNGNDNVVEFNEFHSIAQATGDVGVIYIGGGFTGRGNIIRHNYFHHIKNTPHGYGVVTNYLDNNSSGQTVCGNIYFDVPRATYIGGGRDNVIENNVMINCQPAFHLDPRGLNWRIREIGKGTRRDLYEELQSADYTKPPYSKYPGLATMLDQGDPKAPSNNLVTRNIVVGGRWKEFVDQWGHMELESVFADTEREREFVTYTNNLVTRDDPGFVDAANWNFQFKDDAPVWKLGFKRIPVEKIGLYIDEFRTSLPPKKPWLY